VIKTKKKRRIVVDIVTIFLSLLLSITFIIIFYSYLSTSKAVLAQADNMIEQTHRSVIDNLSSVLKPTPFLTISGRLISDDVLGFDDMQTLTTFMHVILQSYPELDNVYVADTHGNIFTENHVTEDSIKHRLISFINYDHIPPGTEYISQYVTRTNDKAFLTIHYKTAMGRIIKTDIIQNIHYDPRTRPWYIGAKKTPTQHWMGLYKFFGSAVPGVTISSAVIVNNKFVGVISADLGLHAITDHLRTFEINQKGTIFIVNDTGQLIAYEKPLPSGLNVTLPNINDINDPIFTLPYQLHRTLQQNSFNFRLNGTRYIANFTPFSLSDAEKWEVATIIPANVFIGELKRTNEHNMVFSSTLMIIGIVLVAFFSRRISRPIIQLSDETREMTELRFSHEISLNSHIYEIYVMANALNAMKSALSSFVKYVPKVLVKQLLQTKVTASVGGEKKTITVLFTDIQDFTEITEKTNPELLMSHISEYFNELTKVIQQHNGNIDKYIGDSIMAFWNTPLDNPHHVRDACLATLACRQHVHALNQKWKAVGKPVFITRFGLNTGDAIVGNMGSSDRLNYTVLGDTVNLASRLEGINKNYGTEIIVSEFIYEQCKDQFIFKLIDQVQVRGKHQHVKIYELIAVRDH
jgi:adenylate cyclase